MQVIISLLIGYPLLVVGHNFERYWPNDQPASRQYLLLIPVFFLIGVLGTEGQLLADSLLFNILDYLPFQAGGIYLFNGILSSILGMMFRGSHPKINPVAAEDPAEVTTAPLPEKLTKIPLRKGETTAFIPLDDIIYFEAYDNYSLLYDAEGERSLCSYSLSHLESRLDDRFLRVHRKYLINTDGIAGITPHLKGRYVITFTDAKGSSVRSSAGFTDQVKALMKL